MCERNEWVGGKFQILTFEYFNFETFIRRSSVRRSAAKKERSSFDFLSTSYIAQQRNHSLFMALLSIKRQACVWCNILFLPGVPVQRFRASTMSTAATTSSSSPSAEDVILKMAPLPVAGPFPTLDPFLFCVYHKDDYPEAMNDQMEIYPPGNGADFNPDAPYRMYHGDSIPGFPQHPHRGFETVTATMEGIVDHADSVGNAGRYGQGDVQWMTAGKGRFGQTRERDRTNDVFSNYSSIH